MNEKFSAKATAKSNLEQAIRDFIQASKQNGDSQYETVSDIIDAICDGSDREIIFTEP